MIRGLLRKLLSKKDVPEGKMGVGAIDSQQLRNQNICEPMLPLQRSDNTCLYVQNDTANPALPLSEETVIPSSSETEKKRRMKTAVAQARRRLYGTEMGRNRTIRLFLPMIQHSGRGSRVRTHPLRQASPAVLKRAKWSYKSMYRPLNPPFMK